MGKEKYGEIGYVNYLTDDDKQLFDTISKTSLSENEKHFFRIAEYRQKHNLSEGIDLLLDYEENPDWDGKWIYENVDCVYPEHHADGDVIMTFDDELKIWDELTIDGEHLEKILSESLIHDIC